jgi:hypothetical protein
MHKVFFLVLNVRIARMQTLCAFLVVLMGDGMVMPNLRPYDTQDRRPRMIASHRKS